MLRALTLTALCAGLAACAPPPPAAPPAEAPGLEAEVAALRAEMDALLPALERAARGNAALAQALADIRARPDPAPVAPPAPTTIAPAPPAAAPPRAQTEITPKAQAPKAQAPKAQATKAQPKAQPSKAQTPKAQGTTVTALRLGAHPGRTRLVLDLDGPMAATHSFDAGERLLLITLPGAKAWAAPEAQRWPKNPHLAGYTTTPDPTSGGVLLAVEVRPGAEPGAHEALRPADGRGHRLAFDFATR
jgi:hypothetical protein